jgi:hypothetical protein
MSSDKQPVPRVTDADVERVVRRDFAPALHPEVMAVLAQYGKSEWQREAPRVRLAALKISGGRLEALRDRIDAACRDYRDVLIPAEYPGYYEKSMKGKFARGEKRLAIEADRAQYSEWLHKM